MTNLDKYLAEIRKSECPSGMLGFKGMRITDVDKLLSIIEVLRAALNHSDINKLDCDCEYPEGGKPTCIKHCRDEAIKEAEKICGGECE